MKIRTGFVSNSSSTAFCLMTDADNHDAALHDLPIFVQKAVEWLKYEKTKFLGHEIVFMIEMEGVESSWQGFETDEKTRKEFIDWCLNHPDYKNHWILKEINDTNVWKLGYLAFKIYRDITSKKDVFTKEICID